MYPGQQQMDYQPPVVNMGMQPMGYQPSQVRVMTSNVAIKSDDEFSASARKQMKWLSLTQLILGILSIICGIVLVSLQAAYGYDDVGSRYDDWLFSNLVYGVWIGFYFVGVAGVGLGAVQQGNTCLITVAMVLNIISAALFWAALIILASIGVALTRFNKCYWNGYCDEIPVHHAYLAMDAMLIIIAYVELVVAIWSAVLCCRAVCRCCKPRIVTPSAPEAYGLYPNQGQAGTSGVPETYGLYPA